MKFNVPVTVVIEAASPQQALENARAVQKLLDEPMVKTILQTNQVNVQQIVVFQPIAK